jgi:hypothetical protein
MAWWFGVRTLAGKWFSLLHTHPARPLGLPSLLYNGQWGSILGDKTATAWCWQPNLVHRLRMSRAIPVLHLCLHGTLQETLHWYQLPRYLCDTFRLHYQICRSLGYLTFDHVPTCWFLSFYSQCCYVLPSYMIPFQIKHFKYAQTI